MTSSSDPSDNAGEYTEVYRVWSIVVVLPQLVVAGAISTISISRGAVGFGIFAAMGVVAGLAWYGFALPRTIEVTDRGLRFRYRWRSPREVAFRFQLASVTRSRYFRWTTFRLLDGDYLRIPHPIGRFDELLTVLERAGVDVRRRFW